MFSLAYVLLPFAETSPSDAIRSSLARFEMGRRGDVPDAWLAFADETAAVRCAYEATYTFVDQGDRGMRIEGGEAWDVDTARVRDEMRRRGLERWTVRFAAETDLDTFQRRFGTALERHPATGDYGRWLNPLGRWDWWDLGGRFDGCIIGDPVRGNGRTVSTVSSDPSPGRSILANIEDQLGAALGQEPSTGIDVLTDRNVELVSTLLADARAGRENARPGALVLPSDAMEDRWRWLSTWPTPGPAEGFAQLGLSADATWEAVAEAAYERFEDHWAAAVAFHH